MGRNCSRPNKTLQATSLRAVPDLWRCAKVKNEIKIKMKMKNILILFITLLFVSCVSTKDYHFKLSKNGDIDLNGKSIKKVSQIELD